LIRHAHRLGLVPTAVFLLVTIGFDYSLLESGLRAVRDRFRFFAARQQYPEHVSSTVLVVPTGNVA